MGRVIVMAFVSLDGITEDPDGSEKTPQGGWMFRYGPEAVAGDKFGLGEVLDTGVMLLGRRTWELFAGIWPGREDEFSAKMNAMPKLVASRSLDRTDAWQNSSVLKGDLLAAVQEHKQEHDVMVDGQRQRRPRAGGPRPDRRVPAAGVPADARHGQAPVPGRQHTGRPGPGLGRDLRPGGAPHLHPAARPAGAALKAARPPAGALSPHRR